MVPTGYHIYARQKEVLTMTKSAKTCSYPLITIYVQPIKVNQEVDNSKYVDATAALLSQCFGGSTTHQHWVIG